MSTEMFRFIVCLASDDIHVTQAHNKLGDPNHRRHENVARRIRYVGSPIINLYFKFCRILRDACRSNQTDYSNGLCFACFCSKAVKDRTTLTSKEQNHERAKGLEAMQVNKGSESLEAILIIRARLKSSGGHRMSAIHQVSCGITAARAHPVDV